MAGLSYDMFVKKDRTSKEILATTIHLNIEVMTPGQTWTKKQIESRSRIGLRVHFFLMIKINDQLV